MSPSERVAVERRLRPRYAAAAVVAAILIVVAAVVELGGAHVSIDEVTLQLVTLHRRGARDVIGAAVNGIGLVAFALALGFLFDCTRARRPATHPAAKLATVIGGPLAAVSGIAYAIVLSHQAHTFVTRGMQTYEQAHHLLSSPGFVALQEFGPLPALLLAIGVVFISLNAMRTGLLTRFMGYLGIFVGVLQLFPTLGSPVPVVPGFWLLALAVLFAGRWPSGDPLAWKTGRAEAWPSAAEQREQREQRVRGGGGRGAARAGRPAPAPAAPAPVAGDGGRTSRAATPKRKRKRRK
jgi:hypothetical protein